MARPRLAIALAVIVALTACTSSGAPGAADAPVPTATPALADLPTVSPTEPPLPD
ncbi:MAG: hypothetical protein IH961_00030 [Chloroflexi bacterium]|nr:hypothetical protein [Chloroflexota bacterium]